MSSLTIIQDLVESLQKDINILNSTLHAALEMRDALKEQRTVTSRLGLIDEADEADETDKIPKYSECKVPDAESKNMAAVNIQSESGKLVKQFMLDRGRPVTVNEIVKGTKVSRSWVGKLLRSGNFKSCGTKKGTIEKLWVISGPNGDW